MEDRYWTSTRVVFTAVAVVAVLVVAIGVWRWNDERQEREVRDRLECVELRIEGGDC